MEDSSMKRTTVDLDEELIEEAMKASGARTMHEAIERGLRELIRARARASLRERLGKAEIDLSHKELLRRRHGR
jgi:Arc/MetJ family transcription regulator